MYYPKIPSNVKLKDSHFYYEETPIIKVDDTYVIQKIMQHSVYIPKQMICDVFSTLSLNTTLFFKKQPKIGDFISFHLMENPVENDEECLEYFRLDATNYTDPLHEGIYCNQNVSKYGLIKEIHKNSVYFIPYNVISRNKTIRGQHRFYYAPAAKFPYNEIGKIYDLDNTYRFLPGTFVKHFKRELCKNDNYKNYIYKIYDYAKHTETGETLVIYQAMYEDPEKGINYDVFARPFDMFMSEVDKGKYPNVLQKYRFEALTEEELRQWGL